MELMSKVTTRLSRIKRTGLRINWLRVTGVFIGALVPLLWSVITAYASDCPPGGYDDCESAATTAQNPLIPILGGLLGGFLGPLLTGILGGAPVPAPAAQSAPGASGSVEPWDPWVGLGDPANNPFTDFHGGEGPGKCGLQGLPNYWVNTATLGLVISDVLFVCHGLGPAIKIQLNYNGSGMAGIFGANWAFSYDSTINQTGDMLVLARGSGQRLRYRLNSNLEPGNPNLGREAVSLDGKFDRLFDYGQYWLLIEKDTHLTHRYDRSPGASFGRLTSIADSSENSLKILYNGDGTISAITDAADRSIRLAYDGQRRCTSVTLPDGRTANFTYDAWGNLVRVVDLARAVIEYQYDANHYLTRMIVGGDRKTTTFIYQASGQGRNISAVTDAQGNTTRYEMASVSPRQVRIIDPEGKSTLYYSTKEGLTERVVDPLGNAVQFGYSRGLRVSIQNKNGHITGMEYDAKGNLTRVRDPQNNSWSFAHDAYDNLLSSTNPLGETTHYTYNERQQLTSLTSPSGAALIFGYDAKGQFVAMTNPSGSKTGFEYDRFGNLTAIVSPLGEATRISYDGHGLVMTGITDARGNTTKFQFDGNNRLTRVNHADGATRTNVYDCCAGIATIDENGNRTEFIRSPLLNIEQSVGPLHNRTLYSYDRCSRLVSGLDASGRRWTLTYDATDRLIQMTDPRGQALRMNYDPQGNLISFWDERDKQTRFAYDVCNLPTQIIDSLGQSDSFTWDASRRLQTLVNARGGKIFLAYDTDGRLASRSYDGVEVAAFKYDVSGNLSSVRDSTGETTYIYDSASRLISIGYPDGLKLGFSYDAAGNIRTITYPNGLVVEYAYDSRNRVASAAWEDTSISFHYDGVGNLIGESRSNGTESSYRYDAEDQLTGTTHQSNQDRLIEITYTRDAIGNIIGESAFLPLAPVPDAVALTATYNDNNQITTRGSDTFTYDADGNLTGISGGKWHAVYDAANRLVEVRRNAGLHHYTYDGLGQRIKATNGSSSISYHYDRVGRLLFKADEGGRIEACYVYRGATLVARVKSDRKSDFYHFDKTGNTLALTGPDGKILSAYAYSPFGGVVKTSGAADDNPFTYVGQYGVMDDGDGLFFMKNRYYDADTGRFLQRDPIGLSGGTNLYAYVRDNPVNHIDPEGLQDPVLIGGFLAITLLAAWFTGKQLAPFDAATQTIQTRAQNPAAPLPQMPSPKDTVKSLAQVPLTLVTGAGPPALTAVTRYSCFPPGLTTSATAPGGLQAPRILTPPAASGLPKIANTVTEGIELLSTTNDARSVLSNTLPGQTANVTP